MEEWVGERMGYNAEKHRFGEHKVYGEKDNARFFVGGGVPMNNEAFHALANEIIARVRPIKRCAKVRSGTQLSM